MIYFKEVGGGSLTKAPQTLPIHIYGNVVKISTKLGTLTLALTTHIDYNTSLSDW